MNRDYKRDPSVLAAKAIDFVADLDSVDEFRKRLLENKKMDMFSSVDKVRIYTVQSVCKIIKNIHNGK